jgi:hypothetical protein
VEEGEEEEEALTVATTMTTMAMDREMDPIEITITIITTIIIIIATKVCLIALSAFYYLFLSPALIPSSLPLFHALRYCFHSISTYLIGLYLHLILPFPYSSIWKVGSGNKTRSHTQMKS